MRDHTIHQRHRRLRPALSPSQRLRPRHLQAHRLVPYSDFNATTLDAAFDAVSSHDDATAVPFLVADFTPSASGPNLNAPSSVSGSSGAPSVAQTGTASSTGSAPKETTTSHSGAPSNSPAAALLVSGILCISAYVLGA
ncbi:hypothetical protein BV20DRAFT_409669 [Pilatotrama ljubarskyi]|nr:hypothetical protein BV20DRAFT_409669 [Pilatotrama ljubarskyi]